MKPIPTRYPHTYTGNGSRRMPPCEGFMEIATDDKGVLVRCLVCGEGYRFLFVMEQNGREIQL